MDHCIILSEAYLAQNPHLSSLENLDIWPIEPTAENILLKVKSAIEGAMPPEVKLCRLKLYETADSYAEWEA